MTPKRIYLSAPNVGEAEQAQLQRVIDGGWIAPAGPELNAFELELEKKLEGRRALALNSGTSALHLSLILAGVEKTDEVVVGTFTFTAGANVVRYQGAVPVFLDSEKDTWNLDPELLSEYLSSAKKLPKAVIVTHLYGVPAKIGKIRTICESYNVPLIEDAAEALGSTFENQQVGSFGHSGILSFNGNKIITTSAGGALIVNGGGYTRGLHLATQANEEKFGYEHSEVGYNYRMSNVLAGIGLAQLDQLAQFVSKKREIAKYYETKLNSQVFEFPDEPAGSFCNRWLTTPLIKKEFRKKIKPLDLIKYLDRNGVESRLLWKPLHLHKVNRNYEFHGSGVAEQLFGRGLCLPSGTKMSGDELSTVAELIERFLESV